MTDSKINIKSNSDYKKMKAGGKKLALVKKELAKKIAAGVSAKEIEDLACKLIKEQGGKPSFKMVPKYKWATCVNVNSGVVHGIPHESIVFKDGDVVSVDVGIFYQGFHTDTSLTVGVNLDKKMQKFLEIGKKTLKKAILEAKVGNRIYDVSKAMQDGVSGEGYTPLRALVGHGIGKELHESPHVPCVAEGKYEDSPEITEGLAIAIEVMYAQGGPGVKIEDDNWTISMRDGKISALFEETVFITKKGPDVLTE